MDLNLYYYKAIITDVYDGDTITAEIDLGCGIWLRGEKLRLYGINAPEMRGQEKPQGIVTRDWLRKEVWKTSPTGHVIIETKKDKTGKYGRLLAIVYIPIAPDAWLNANQEMVRLGLAEAKEY